MHINDLAVGNATRRGRNRNRDRRSTASVDLRKQGAVSAVRDQKACGGFVLTFEIKYT